MPIKDKKRGKGGKFKKKKNVTSISNEDIEFLVAKTNYDAVEIAEWFTGFIEDNPDGTLSKEKMMDMYASVLPGKKAKVFVDQIFVKFDTDGSGSIDFKVRCNILL
jgi:Ca2+-binding EF-hand superfamily protein